MSAQALNHFSMISRLFGNLWLREPSDAILNGVFSWLRQKGLSQVWPLNTDKESQAAIDSLQIPIAADALQAEYQSIFAGDNAVATEMASYGLNPADFIEFRQQCGMPVVENTGNSRCHGR